MRGVRKASVLIAGLLAAVLAQPAVPASARTTWERHAGHDPAGTANGDVNSLHSVSCWNQTGCMAVGDYGTVEPGQSLTSAFAERWDGRAWRAAAPVAVPDANRTELESVSCVSSNWCVAVGWADNVPLIERWLGSSWQRDDVTTGSGGTLLADVSCTSRSFCVATGSTSGMRWNGTRWANFGAPANTTVSCRSSSWCMAVGTDSNYRGVAYRWDGSQWHTKAMPTPTTTNAVYLRDIACASTRWCAAVGYYYTSAGYDHTLFYVFNSGTWRRVASPQPAAPGTARLGGVACPAAGSCVLVGSWASPSTRTLMPVAKSWRGGSGYSSIGLDTTGISTSQGLAGVSCAGGRCAAVGDYYTSNAALLALIESGTQP